MIIALSLTILPQFAAECLRRSNNDHIGAKFGEERVTDVSQILTRSGAVIRKRNRVDIFCRLSTMHEHDRQTDKQTYTDHGTVTSISICRGDKRFRLSAVSHKNNSDLKGSFKYTFRLNCLPRPHQAVTTFSSVEFSLVCPKFHPTTPIQNKKSTIQSSFYVEFQNTV